MRGHATKQKAERRVAELEAEIWAMKSSTDMKSTITRRLDAEILALKSSINTNSIMGRLPAEILANIFLTYASSCLAGRNHSRYVWIRVTHVCRHWRTVALDCSNLWSTILPAKPELVEALLHRSRNASPLVDFGVGGWKTRTSLKTRIRILCGTFQPAFRCWKPSFFGDGSDFRFPPRSILQQGAPRLKELELCGCGIPWRDQPLQAPLLAKLYVSNNFEPRTPKEDRLMDLFIETLEGMPLLQEVNLQRSLPVGDNDSRRIRLPALKTLALADEVSTLTGFFQMLDKLEAESVRILSEDESVFSPAPVEEMLTALATRWVIPDGRGAPKFQEVHHFYGDARLLLCAWLEPRPETPRTLFMSSKAPQPFVYDNMVTFMKHFDTSSILRMSFDSDICASTRLLGNQIATLRSLESILMTDEAMASLIDTLEEGVMAKTSRPRIQACHTPFFPSLLSIQCKMFDFDPQRERATETTKRLARILKDWPETYPLRELSVVNCRNFTSEDYKLLRRELPKMTVTWDGALQVYHSDSEGSRDDEAHSGY
ncbi:hypothetical protein NMY22_g13916 [Coprinellus aureogranulatus]|nr:hypothetical protein NMY22_g13916 [Coprinellus aureogranulatus]